MGSAGFKGQSATEYLLTYGWAIIIVIVATVTLIYLGIVTPPETMAPYCLFGQGLSCKSFFINSTGHLALDIQNDGGGTIQVLAVRCTEEANATLNASDALPFPVPIPNNDHSLITNGSQQCYSYNAAGQFVAATGRTGGAFRGNVYLKYRESGTSVEHVTAGAILMKYEGGVSLPTPLPTPTAIPTPTAEPTPFRNPTSTPAPPPV